MLENMNTKRWIAFGVALLIIGISALSTGLSNKINKEKRMKQMEETVRNSVGDFDENVLEDGSADKRIAVVTVDGTILDTPQSSMLGAGYDHKATLEALDDILQDDTVKGVLLKVNSPGGGVYESAELYQKLNALKDHKKKLYVSMGNVAASGGYYISSPADKIYAAPSTLTGSIGVIMGGNNFSGLMEKLGVKDQAIKSAAHKDIGSSTRPMTDEERSILQGVIDDMYGEFLQVVSKGRHMTVDQVRPLADGSVYTGNQAKANGLVDAIGYGDDALTALKRDLKLDDPQVFEYTSDFGSTFLSNLFSSKFTAPPVTEEQVAAKLFLESLSGTSRPMYLYGGI
ncbi:signal peptide peptidase SppA [Aedoeadaptatus coxii]|uniref:signal peptide peptidase SppA n=1 Tax=Aedoeadaptatus coxii TaxID=755172 RepID=UPI00176B3025|nr:signal peptide peptidase SppA [Peptoniphilus coxii]CAC9933724.1 signal peptide peptidase SppA [Peptoniphilus coxii]